MFSGLSEVDPCSDRCNWISTSAELTVTSPKVLISFSLFVGLDLCMPCVQFYDQCVTLLFFLVTLLFMCLRKETHKDLQNLVCVCVYIYVCIRVCVYIYNLKSITICFAYCSH